MHSSSRSWHALGTSVHVLVTDGDPDDASDAVASLLDRVDRTYSRFRADSELSVLNAIAGTRTTVSPLLGRAIETALRAAHATDGLVDPTVGRAMRLVGYDRDLRELLARTDPIVLHEERIPGWQTVRYSAVDRSVQLRSGVELDLGSTGKALAADLAAVAALEAAGSGGVLVSLGGDIAMAGTLPDGGWPVLAAEDSDIPVDTGGEVIALRAGGLATSGVTIRRWRRGSIQLHHLLDPRTGLPVNGPWRTASVVAASCVDANTASTAAIVMGEAAISWLQGLGVAARLVSQDGEVHRVGTWPAPAVAVAVP